MNHDWVKRALSLSTQTTEEMKAKYKKLVDDEKFSVTNATRIVAYSLIQTLYDLLSHSFGSDEEAEKIVLQLSANVVAKERDPQNVAIHIMRKEDKTK